jgi:PAS domain S-box-containing protein
MKILYVATDRRAADLAAFALRTVAPDVAITWAASLDDARRWIDGNRDVATLIVEVGSDDPNCASFVSQVRGLGVTAKVIVVSVNVPAPPLPSLKAVADEIVTKDLSFLNDLPDIVKRTLHSTRPPAAARRRLRLLYVGDAALARECLGRPGGSIEVVGAVPGSSGKFDPLPADARSGMPLPFEILLIEHGYPGVDTLAILQDIAARKLHVPVMIVSEWDEDLAVLALKLGAGDYVVKSKASFRAVYFRLNRLIAHAALLDEQSRLRDAHASAIDQQSATRDRLERRLAETQTALRNVEQRLNDAVAAIEQARQDRSADAAAAAEHHARREFDFALRLGEASAARQKLEQQLADRDAALRHAEQRATTEQQAALHFARRQTELQAALTDEAAQRRTLETKLAEADVSHQVAEQQRLADAAAAADKLGQQHAELTTRLAQAIGARDALEQRMNDAVAAIEQARQDRAAEAAAAVEHFTQREAVLVAKLRDAATTQERLERRLADADTALRHAAQRAAAEQHAARQQATERQALVEAELARETANREILEHQLADAKLALQRAEAHHASEVTAADARFAEHQTRDEARLSEAAATQDALQARLVAAEAAAQRDKLRHASEMSDAATRLTEHQEKADARSAQATAAISLLESKLADRAAALERVEEQAAAERQAASEEAAQHHATFEAELTREITNRQALAKALADAEAARQRAEQQHGSEIATAAAQLADHQQQTETRLAEAAGAADALAGKLADAAAALKHAEYQAAVDRQAATEHALRRRAKFYTQLAQDAARRQALAKQLGDTEAALEGVERQAAAERQAASEAAAQHQAEFEAELSREVTNRQALAKALADAEVARQSAEEQHRSEMAAAAEQAQRRFMDEVGVMRERAREHETRLEERAARERAEWESARAEGQERIRHLQMEGDLARRSLVQTEEQIQRLENAHTEERDSFERARMAVEADLARQRAQYTALQQTLDQTRATAQEALERVSRDRATERARFDALVAEHETQLQEQAARKQASDEAAAKALADVQHRLRLTLEAGNRDSRAVAQLQEQLKALGEELRAIRSQREVLKTVADSVPELRKQIDDIRAEHRRQFDHTPANMCRCSRDGAITQANRALAALLGYHTPEELQKVDFAGTVFESGDELQWIVDRCLASRSTESVETTWRRKDGSRIIVRVLAVATTADSIDLAAQDVTTLRVLEEKLRNSQRLEAVARYGSEIAVNCHNLLRHVKQEGQQWLARIDSDTARYQGELLLDEVTRAEGFLRLLAVYGNEQKNAPDLVDVHKVLRDLEPVLKQVAGGNIEIVLPKASTPLNLDVEAERVERILVNVAAYGRERMPLGGRLMIEVASVVVDRTFVAKYPNVRPGAHVLLTVTEARGAARPDFSAAVRTQASGANATASASDNPGVDLGALQALVSDCGGHLWMMVVPPGDMVLKIHLPRRVLDRADPRVPAKGPGRARWITRAFGAHH